MNRFGVSRTVARETVQALAMLGPRERPARQAHRDLPSRGVGHPQLGRAGGDAARGQGRTAAPGPLRVPDPDRAAGGGVDGRVRQQTRTSSELVALAAEMARLAQNELAVADVMEADRSFHDLIARASENRVVVAVSRDIREVIGTLWGFSSLEDADAEHVAEQHRTIATRSSVATPRPPPRPCTSTSSGRRAPTCTGSASRPSCASPWRPRGRSSGARHRHRHRRDVHRHGRLRPRDRARSTRSRRRRRRAPLARRSSTRSTRAGSPRARSRRSRTGPPSARTR